MFDDVVEHCGEGAHKYLPTCFPAFMDGVTEVCCTTPCTVARLTQTASVACFDLHALNFVPGLRQSFERNELSVAERTPSVS